MANGNPDNIFRCLDGFKSGFAVWIIKWSGVFRQEYEGAKANPRLMECPASGQCTYSE